MENLKKKIDEYLIANSFCHTETMTEKIRCSEEEANRYEQYRVIPRNPNANGSTEIEVTRENEVADELSQDEIKTLLALQTLENIKEIKTLLASDMLENVKKIKSMGVFFVVMTIIAIIAGVILYFIK